MMRTWALLSLLGLVSSSAAAAPFEVIRLTNNQIEDRDPAIADGRVVWTSRIDGNQLDAEVMLHENGVTTRLTNDGLGQINPAVSPDRVAWATLDGDFEIWVHDGSTSVQVSNNAYTDSAPALDGTSIAWTGFPTGTAGQIFYDDGSGVRQLTGETSFGVSPSISGPLVVWDDTNNIFLFDGTTITPVTTGTSIAERTADVWGTSIVWSATGPSGPLGVFIRENGVTRNLSPTGRVPKISGDLVVWEAFDGNDQEIFLYDGQQIVQLTDSDEQDISPDIWGNWVVWEHFERLPGGEPGEGDWEIYMAYVPEPGYAPLTLAFVAAALRRTRRA